MDGGIADNLAMRSIINALLAMSGDPEHLRAAGLNRVRRILLISADGQASKDTSKAKIGNISAIDQIFDAVSGTQIDSYNFETLILANEEIERLRAAIARQRCAEARDARCDDVKAYFVHLSLGKIEDPNERARLEHIPTGLTLDREDVDRLAAAGEALVRNSPLLRDFENSLADIN